MFKKFNLLTILLFMFVIVSANNSQASKIEDIFLKAIDTLDFREADAYAKENPDKIPFEIDKALAKSRDQKIKKFERLNFVKLAEAMASSYGKISGDKSYNKKVKGRYFEEKLSEQTIPEVSLKRHDIKIINKRFSIDNLVIDVGDSVVWINKDKRPHTFRSSLDIGKRGLYSGKMLTHREYKHKFNEPGEYYYHSIIYKKKMIGKITVVEAEVTGGGAKESVEEPDTNETPEPEEVDTVPAEKPKESVADKKKRINELLKKFDYQPDE